MRGPRLDECLGSIDGVAYQTYRSLMSCMTPKVAHRCVATALLRSATILTLCLLTAPALTASPPSETPEPTELEGGNQIEVPAVVTRGDVERLLRRNVEDLAPVTLEQMVREFHIVSFALEFPKTPSAGRITKWAAPIRYALVGERAARIDYLVSVIFERIRKWTGLEIEEVDYDDPSINFFVGFLDDDQVDLLVARVPSTGPEPCSIIHREPIKAGEIQSISLYIDRRMSEPRKVVCVIQKLFMAMGLAGSAEIQDSLLNYTKFHVILPKDEMIFRILYDPRLKPGDKWDDIKGAVRTIIAEGRMYGILRFSNR